MKNLRIGIPGYISDTSFGVGKTHLLWCQQFGNPEIIMPHEDLRKVDILYLPGGADLNPANYGQVPNFYTQNSDVFKEYFFRERLKNYVEAKIPIFGVCLGFQMINLFFGSEIEQHLMAHPQSPQRREEGHKVRLPNGNKALFPVNSHHHQGFLETKVAKCLEVLLVEDDKSDYDRVVEAVKHKSLPIAGVQYHPEEWYDDYSKNLFESIAGIL